MEGWAWVMDIWAGAGQNGEEVAGPCRDPVRRAGGWRVSCGEEGPFGDMAWSLDGAVKLTAQGEEGRKGVAPWVDLKR